MNINIIKSYNKTNNRAEINSLFYIFHCINFSDFLNIFLCKYIFISLVSYIFNLIQQILIEHLIYANF